VTSEDLYTVKWTGYGRNAIAYINGPGVEFLRLDMDDNLDTDAIAEALQAAHNAGQAAS
jgi:GT2 family glycosyltransferase